MAQVAKTPRIQLVLNVQEDGQRERIRKVTAGHEVVEVDGFIFKRQRAVAPAPPPENSQPNSWDLAAQATAPADGSADCYNVSSQLFARMAPALRALAPGAPAADRLRIIAGSICATEAERASAGGPAVAPVLEAFVASLDEALHRGGISLTALPPAALPPAADRSAHKAAPAGDYTTDLRVRKAGMRARLAALEQEEAQWRALLEQVAQLGSSQAEAEEATLRSGEQQGSEGAIEGSRAPVEGNVPGLVASLRHARQSVHRELAMQVEGVCKLVGDMEELVDQANSTAQSMQAEYHSEKFRTFPHVDSPARLIRELVRPAMAPAGGA